MSRPSIHQALRLAKAQFGDKYIFGAEASASDPNPEAFDCSELMEWVAARCGVPFVDGSMNQRAFCQSKGTMISLAKARRTPGALIFRDISVTGVGHVAMSLGNGFTGEARGSAYGVGRFTFDNRGWTEAALFPGFDYKKDREPKMDDFWVVLGRYGGRWGRSKELSNVHDSIKEAEAKHGIALVLQRKEPVDIELAKKAEFPRWLADKHKAKVA